MKGYKWFLQRRTWGRIKYFSYYWYISSQFLYGSIISFMQILFAQWQHSMCEEGPFLRREMHKAIGLIVGDCFSASYHFLKEDFTLIFDHNFSCLHSLTYIFLVRCCFPYVQVSISWENLCANNWSCVLDHMNQAHNF